MSSFKVFDIAGSGMSAESVRLNTVASNLANADSVSGDPTQVYRAKHPVFQAVQALGARGQPHAEQASASVKVRPSPPTRRRPSPTTTRVIRWPTPTATYYSSNVNVVEEMTDMISASRSYQNNVEVMNTARNLMLDTLKLGQS